MSLARLYRDQAKPDQAVQLLENVLHARRRSLGPQHPYTLISMYELARTMEQVGRLREAEELHAQVVEIRRRTLGARAVATLNSLVALGRAQIAQEKFTMAEATLRECLRGSEVTFADKWQLFHTRAILGIAVAGQGRYAEAEMLLVDGVKGMLLRVPTIPQESQVSIKEGRAWLVKVYEGLGRPEQAWELRD